jgi:hypothetical protein
MPSGARSSYGILHSEGSGEDGVSLDQLPDLYEELRTADQEHGDVSVVHEETGWCISSHRDGRVVFAHLGRRGAPRHMSPVPKARVLELWRRLIEGDLDGLAAEPWRPGYDER